MSLLPSLKIFFMTFILESNSSNWTLRGLGLYNSPEVSRFRGPLPVESDSSQMVSESVGSGCLTLEPSRLVVNLRSSPRRKRSTGCFFISRPGYFASHFITGATLTISFGRIVPETMQIAYF